MSAQTLATVPTRPVIDQTGQVVPTPASLLEPLNTADARTLTNQIKTTAEQLWVLLEQAHNGRAWEALGYGTWAQYVKAEFNMSRSRSYQLLDLAHVTRAIESSVHPDAVDGVNLTEGSARAIKPHLAQVIDQVHDEAGDSDDPEDVARALAKAVQEVRDADTRPTQPSTPVNRDGDEADDDEYDDEYDIADDTDGPGSPLGDPFAVPGRTPLSDLPLGQPVAGPHSDPPAPVVPEEAGTADVRDAVTRAHGVYTALDTLSALPENLASVVRVMPPARKDMARGEIPAAIARLEALLTELQESA